MAPDAAAPLTPSGAPALHREPPLAGHLASRGLGHDHTATPVVLRI